MSLTSLRWLACLAGLLDTLRASDIPGKSARNEYLVLLPETDEDGALIVAQRLAGELAEFEHVVGVAVLGLHGTTPAELLEHARASAQGSSAEAA
jgi:hypothetical protein